jgi:two-component system OmpR family response regulator
MPRRQTLLVAEDDQGVRDLIRVRLTSAGYDVQVAYNGREAVDHIRASKPDGVVLDINMPVMDGFEVLQRLRDEGGGGDPPVLILTARHAAEDVRRAIGLGAKDYLTKPFNDGQLLARVARLLRPRLAPVGATGTKSAAG